MIKKKDEIVVIVNELNSEGKGISRLEDGFVIFSENTLPGDEALIQIKKIKSNYAEARLVKLIKGSENRISPECAYFGVCGGCKIQNYRYECQLEFKRNVVRDALERIGKFKDLEIPDILKSDEIFYYRNKMEFSFSDDEWLTEKQIVNVNTEKEKFALGLHVPGFYSKIINIGKCFLMSELSNDILNFTRDFFKNRGSSVYSTLTQSGFLRFLIIRQSKNTSDLMINLITYDHDEKLMSEYSGKLTTIFPQITTIINSITQSKAQVAVGQKEYILYGSGFITEKLITESGKEYVFKISTRSFFQTNTLQAQKLFNTLVSFSDFKKTDNILDLYCGTGSISVFISDLVNTVFGIELVNDSITDAVNNAGLNNIKNAEFECSDIKDFLEKEGSTSGYNKLVLDPPRAGLHPKICEILSGTKFEKIIYVSCNPHTQARDLQIICRNGNYKIERIQPVDMFPHTYHVENVISLTSS